MVAVVDETPVPDSATVKLVVPAAMLNVALALPVAVGVKVTP